MRDGRTNGTRSGRYENDFASLRFGNLEQAEPCGAAGHADDAEPMLIGNAQIGQFNRRHARRWRLVAAEYGAVAPASHMENLRADRKIGIIAFGYRADRTTGHGFAKHEWIGIAFRIVHAAAHIGVNGQPAVRNAELVRAQWCIGCFDHRKIAVIWKPGRAAS